MASNAKIIEIADAVVDLLNAKFSNIFTAERRYLPLFGLDELATLRVSVVPKSIPAIEGFTRDEDTHEYAIDVGVQQKVNPSLLAESDAVLVIAQDVLDRLRNQHLADLDAKFIGIANEPLFVPEVLETKHVLLSIITVTYRVNR